MSPVPSATVTEDPESQPKPALTARQALHERLKCAALGGVAAFWYAFMLDRFTVWTSPEYFTHAHDTPEWVIDMGPTAIACWWAMRAGAIVGLIGGWIIGWLGTVGPMPFRTWRHLRWPMIISFMVTVIMACYACAYAWGQITSRQPIVPPRWQAFRPQFQVAFVMHLVSYKVGFLCIATMGIWTLVRRKMTA
jgi:hypothetical protein